VHVTVRLLVLLAAPSVALSLTVYERLAEKVRVALVVVAIADPSPKFHW
jgi:hypothetical protein